ncbi:hypothetical protein ACFQU2_28635 [Siccirubricoccus deserti]
MLASQRDAFDIPRDVAYLNAASWSPLPRAVQAAGHAGVGRKAQPWTLPAEYQPRQIARARAAAAALIGAVPEDVALVSSVSYGVATAESCCRCPAAAGCWCWRRTIPRRPSNGCNARRKAASWWRRWPGPAMATGPRHCWRRSPGRARRRWRWPRSPRCIGRTAG